MAYNPKIHHRRSIRLQGYDYSKAGLYFITLCCHNRRCIFGKIVVAKDDPSTKMKLNDGGIIADRCWVEIPNHFPNAILHEYVIMPNHVHGIIELKNVGAENLQPRRNEFQKMIPRSIASIVKGFKIGVTKWFRNNTDIHTVWQRNYYEHIIRDDRAYRNISKYIANNPANWKGDKFYE